MADEGKAAFTPVDDQEVSDGDLDRAAAAAVHQARLTASLSKGASSF